MYIKSFMDTCLQNELLASQMCDIWIQIHKKILDIFFLFLYFISEISDTADRNIAKVNMRLQNTN